MLNWDAFFEEYKPAWGIEAIMLTYSDITLSTFLDSIESTGIATSAHGAFQRKGPERCYNSLSGK